MTTRYIHVVNADRPSNRSIPRAMAIIASWVASRASSRWAITRRHSACTRSAWRSSSFSNARRSPRDARAARSASSSRKLRPAIGAPGPLDLARAGPAGTVAVEVPGRRRRAGVGIGRVRLVVTDDDERDDDGGDREHEHHPDPEPRHPAAAPRRGPARFGRAGRRAGPGNGGW